MLAMKVFFGWHILLTERVVQNKRLIAYIRAICFFHCFFAQLFWVLDLGTTPKHTFQQSQHCWSSGTNFTKTTCDLGILRNQEGKQNETPTETLLVAVRCKLVKRLISHVGPTTPAKHFTFVS